MWPFRSRKHRPTDTMQRVFSNAAEDWLRRARNPDADVHMFQNLRKPWVSPHENNHSLAAQQIQAQELTLQAEPQDAVAEDVRISDNVVLDASLAADRTAPQAADVSQPRGAAEIAPAQPWENMGFDRLLKITGPQPDDSWLLPRTRPILIGRSSRSVSALDIDLRPDRGVSRRHARLWFKEDRWWIEDLGSKNGIWLGNANIKSKGVVWLEPGTTIHIGQTVLILAPYL